MKNKNILIPTDFSDNAWNAIRYGLELTKNDIYLLPRTYKPHFGLFRWRSRDAMKESVLLNRSAIRFVPRSLFGLARINKKR